MNGQPTMSGCFIYLRISLRDYISFTDEEDETQSLSNLCKFTQLESGRAGI